MKSRGGILLGLFAGFLFPHPIPAKNASGPETYAQFQFLGAQSCSAAACHNAGPPAAGAGGSEYATWVCQDKHARAYEVLCNERSRRIMKNLGRHSADADSLCLSCHVLPHWDEVKTRVQPSYFKEDGVSCESCHGPAHKWLTEHHKPAWKTKTLAEKQAWGMQDTTPAGRVQGCVTCHVGAAGMDVNHDLIAAGHPPLKFEMADYHGRLVHHWSDVKDRQRQPDFAARLWAAGQVASAQASLRLLEARARTPAAPWPEFAESDCFACHHRLHEPSRPGKRLPVTIPASAWYFALLPQVVPESAPWLESLRTALGKPAPARKEVADLARQAYQGLAPWLTKVAETPVAVDPLFHRFLEKNSAMPPVSWDEAKQVYGALTALSQAKKEMWGIQWLSPSALRSLQAQLHFSGFDSPIHFHPEEFRRSLWKLRQR